jgi:hypothetical protein
MLMRHSRQCFWVGMSLVFVVSGCLVVLLREAFPLTYDEGIHLMWIRLLEAGYAPYTQVYITYPPLYPLLLMVTWHLWPTLDGLRILTLALAFPAVVFTGLITRRIAGDLAGVAAAVLLALTPQFVHDSRAILGELPSVAWSLCGVWLALVYRDSGHRAPLMGSALAIAASLLIKVLSPFTVLLVLFIVVSRHVQVNPPANPDDQHESRRRRLLFDLAWWVAAFAAPLVLALALVDLGSLAAQVIGQRLSARAAYAADDFWASRRELAELFVSDNVWTLLLAVVGLATTLVERTPRRFTLLLWLSLATLMLLIHEPVRYKHFTILLPLMALWAGVAVSQVRTTLSRLAVNTTSFSAGRLLAWRAMTAAISLVLLVSYCVNLLVVVQAWQARMADATPSPDTRQMLDFIGRVTTEDDCLITDDPRLAFWSGRMVPPELAEVSSNRLRSGELTLDQLIAITERYDCQVVAAISNRITKFLPDYEQWVRRHYLGMIHIGEDDLYVAKAATTPRPAHPLRAKMGEVTRLLGYTLPADVQTPGAQLPLVLYWEALTTPDTDYTVFVHGVDDDGRMRFTGDHRPYDGAAPTTNWRPGAIIRDVSWIVLPPDLPPGEYTLRVGMYRVDTMERLPIECDTGCENALPTGRIRVTAKP